MAKLTVCGIVFTREDDRKLWVGAYGGRGIALDYFAESRFLPNPHRAFTDDNKLPSMDIGDKSYRAALIRLIAALDAEVTK